MSMITTNSTTLPPVMGTIEKRNLAALQFNLVKNKRKASFKDWRDRAERP